MGRCCDTRDRLLASTTRLLQARGYSALSVAEICADAGIQKGSFYHFFPSKHDLVLAVLDHIGRMHAGRIAAVLTNVTEARDQLRAMLALLADDMTTAQQNCGSVRGCPLGNLALEMADRDEAIRSKVAEIFHCWQTRLSDVLRNGVERGELTLTDPKTVAQSIVAYIEGAILLAKANNDSSVFAKLCSGVLALVDGSSVALPSEAHRGT
jgi:TetR/AcrR family transcriptional repressor of nem operon